MKCFSNASLMHLKTVGTRDAGFSVNPMEKWGKRTDVGFSWVLIHSAAWWGEKNLAESSSRIIARSSGASDLQEWKDIHLEQWSPRRDEFRRNLLGVLKSGLKRKKKISLNLLLVQSKQLAYISPVSVRIPLFL